MVIVGLFATTYLIYTGKLQVRLFSESAYFSEYSWALTLDN